MRRHKFHSPLYANYNNSPSMGNNLPFFIFFPCDLFLNKSSFVRKMKYATQNYGDLYGSRIKHLHLQYYYRWKCTHLFGNGIDESHVNVLFLPHAYKIKIKTIRVLMIVGANDAAALIDSTRFFNFFFFI